MLNSSMLWHGKLTKSLFKVIQKACVRRWMCYYLAAHSTVRVVWWVHGNDDEEEEEESHLSQQKKISPSRGGSGRGWESVKRRTGVSITPKTQDFDFWSVAGDVSPYTHQDFATHKYSLNAKTRTKCFQNATHGWNLVTATYLQKLPACFSSRTIGLSSIFHCWRPKEKPQSTRESEL